MKIRTYGDPVLRRVATPVERIDDEVRDTCKRMVEAMIRANGAGLAAPQIGVSQRIIVTDVKGKLHVLVNPELVEVSDEVMEGAEGCLSVPGVEATVMRKARVRVRGTGLEGEKVEVEGEGYLSRALQHEIDHLNGVLFVDYLTPARRQSLLKEYSRLEREEVA
jgi:peptide deformylase